VLAHIDVTGLVNDGAAVSAAIGLLAQSQGNGASARRARRSAANIHNRECVMQAAGLDLSLTL